MASINKVILIGNLGRDPELRYTSQGKPVASFTMATTEKWTSKDGDKQEKTEWHRIVLWGRQAEIANQYLKKGSSCYIEGRLTTRSWEDKDKVKHYTTEVEGLNMQFLGGGGGGGGSGGGGGGGSGGWGGGGGGRSNEPPPFDYPDPFPDSSGGGWSGGNSSSNNSGGGGPAAAASADDDLPF
ncbi:MAG: single-stranded DNA-binding protein [Chitinispirillia bacterium]|nr:single-stranded DNA-binding protein [Chitinispirillia bacterium]MCL2269449.1 single-stranded DNA-binding protein [Chitinispirillia bacterium]